MNSNNIGFKKDACPHCGQNTTYLLPLDRGTSIIVKAIAAAVRNKGINMVHPGKEMQVLRKDWNYTRAVNEGVLTDNQIGNMTRARVHGLIARVQKEPGNWCLTSKGAKFLRGERVPQFAVIRKTTAGDRSHKEEYYEPEAYTTDVYQLAKQDEVWIAIDFDIREGRIVKDLPASVPEEQPKTLFES